MATGDDTDANGWDFFISYAQEDRRWAEWIAWQLEDAGYRVLLRAWDSSPGTNWTSAVLAGISRSNRVIAIISNAYLVSTAGEQEWGAALASDPLGISRKLIPVRVEDCSLPALLAPIVPLDLFNVDADVARDRLLDQIRFTTSGRSKPSQGPDFPSFAAPRFPSSSADRGRTARTRNISSDRDFGHLFLAEPLSDEPSIDDRLKFAADVRRLAAIISAESTAPPLSIALLGQWGCGKSSFLRQVEQRVDDTYVGREGYVKSVKHVTFNAWHYNDSHVWTGLIERTFTELAASVDTADSLPKFIEESTKEREELKEEIEDIKRRKQRIQHDLDGIDNSGDLQGVFSKFPSPGKMARIISASLKQAWSDLRTSRTSLVALLALTAVIAGAWFVTKPLIGQATAIATATALYCAAIAQPAWRLIANAAVFTDKQRVALRVRQEDLDKQLMDAQERFTSVDACASLSKYLENQSKPATYERYRGLVGEVRQDLEGLTAALARVRKQDKSRNPLNRIVLYIDDLDRCKPGKVIEVLEAAHLLLAMPLFVVIVAVDVRWLIRCFLIYFSEIFRGANNEFLEARSLEYLDKIFQIQFSLPPMSAADGRFYLESIMPDLDPGDTSTNPEETQGRQRLELPGGDQERRTSSSVADGATMAASSPLGGFAIPARKLTITRREREFIPELAPIIPTPRAGKKLINIYRLIRAAVPDKDADSFLSSPGEGGDFQAVLLMLAIVIVAPAHARILVQLIESSPGDTDITEFLRDRVDDASLDDDAKKVVEALLDIIVRLRNDREVVGPLARYQKWSSEILRFTF